MKTVLVVDDIEDLREILVSEIKAHSSYRVLEAKSGHEAARILKKETVSLVVSDLQMPHGDGLWLLNHLKSCDGPPIIIVSGNSLVKEEEVIEAGALAFFNKPYIPSQLFYFISEVLN